MKEGQVTVYSLEGGQIWEAPQSDPSSRQCLTSSGNNAYLEFLCWVPYAVALMYPRIFSQKSVCISCFSSSSSHFLQGVVVLCLGNGIRRPRPGPWVCSLSLWAEALFLLLGSGGGLSPAQPQGSPNRRGPDFLPAMFDMRSFYGHM